MNLEQLFAAIDSKDTDGFLSFLTEDASFRFGSAPAAQGHEAIRAGVDGFFASIVGSKHAISNVLTKGDTLVCEGTVTYLRHDDVELAIPFTDVFELAGPKICNYKIYIDISPLYEEHDNGRQD
jgi:limonene-1,2-epoxide hydrolase